MDRKFPRRCCLTGNMSGGNISLDDLRRRIENTDLIPSQAPLKIEIDVKFFALKQQGITNLARLRDELKSPGKIEALSDASTVDKKYLILLRREIEGYFPKPVALKDFYWLPKEEIEKLVKNGIRDTAGLRQVAGNPVYRDELLSATGLDATCLQALIKLADLTGIRWVSPNIARMLVGAGYPSTTKVAAADPDDLYEALIRVNEGGRYYKGKVGMRDVKRLIRAAGYVLG